MSQIWPGVSIRRTRTCVNVVHRIAASVQYWANGSMLAPNGSFSLRITSGKREALCYRGVWRKRLLVLLTE
jgi:hypothetical protein